MDGKLADAAKEPAFEVASVRPANGGDGRGWYGYRTDASGGFRVSGMSLSSLVWTAYVGTLGKDGQVSGGPDWAKSDRFDMSAKVDDAYMAGWEKLSDAQRMDRVRPMIRRLLADRFHLKLRLEMRPTPVYVLVQAKGGAKMKEVPAPEPVEGDTVDATARKMRDWKPGMTLPGQIVCSGSGCIGRAVAMSNAIGQIMGSSNSDRLVIDQTGLKGYYDFTINQPRSSESAIADVESDLGLKFEPRVIPMKTYIIDSAAKPSVDGAEDSVRR
jgi:uncharacterized protein (TIGR03435 family)